MVRLLMTVHSTAGQTEQLEKHQLEKHQLELDSGGLWGAEKHSEEDEVDRLR